MRSNSGVAVDDGFVILFLSLLMAIFFDKGLQRSESLL